MSARLKCLSATIVLWSAVSHASAQCDRVKLVPHDPADGQEFSWALAAEEDRVLVGSFGGSADQINGAGYLFERSNGSWAEIKKLTSPSSAIFDGFGQAVALSQGRALIGARYDGELGAEAGAAHVFVRSGAQWTLEASLRASDGAADDEFGQTVALFGTCALVGSAYADAAGDFSGAAYAFELVNGVWTEAAKLVPAEIEAGDVFGFSVALHGDLAAIGAPGDDDLGTSSGAVYVFRREGTTWTLEQRLTPDAPTSHVGFGHALALHADTLLIGTSGDDEQGENSGAALVFVRSGGQWTEQQKLVSGAPSPSAFFGFAVALAQDFAVVGAYGDDHGGVFSQAGSADVFRRNAGQWTALDRLIDVTPESAEYFGFAVAASGESAFVGSPDDHEPGPLRGGTTVVHFAVAEASSYGTGWPGTLGIPTLTAVDPPILGQNTTIQASNSFGAATTGFLLLGFQSTDQPTGSGGSLLVNPAWVFPMSIPVQGADLVGAIPDDPALCGIDLYLQVLEFDQGASHDLSFTAGLALHLGR